MEALEAIDLRRSVRSFTGQAPDEEAVGKVLAAALRAPSAGNLQPWHFYVVWNSHTRKELAEAALSQQHIAGAPVVIVVCTDPERSAPHYGDRGRFLYCLQDAAAATENLLIAATALGLGSCWVGAFDEGAVAGIIGAPDGRLPVTLVPLGYPSPGAAFTTGRRGLEQVVTVIR